MNSEQNRCKQDVSEVLHSVGMEKVAAKELTNYYPECFRFTSTLRAELPKQAQRVIATLVLLEHVLTKSMKPHYSIYHYKNNVHAQFQNILDVSANRETITKCYHETKRHIY